MKTALTHRFIAGALLALLIPVHGLAQVPELISYQGKLVNGTNLVNASTTMVFRLFSAATSGNGVYVETQSVSVVDGLYAVSIGGDPDAGTLRAAMTNQPLYLEVQVGATVLSPRERITASTYALMAARVTNGAVDVAMLNTNSVDARYAPKGAVMPWVDVTSTSQQAQANIGYVARNAAQVVVTLPASPVLGDIVRVSGAGSGGWKLAQNSGQTIWVENLNKSEVVESWTARTGAGSRAWRNMDMSDDGTNLCAAVYDGFIYTSSDGGSTWTNRAASRYWQGLASSGDGSIILAGVNGGFLYVSYDNGSTWTARMTDASRVWPSTAVSHDGKRMAATVWGESSGGYIYTSSDSGSNWTARATDTTRKWNGLACSSNGMTLVAGEYSGYLYMSYDGGVTWTARTAVGTGEWWGFASSADGTKLIGGPDYRNLFRSENSGATWAVCTAGEGDWYCVASSADGNTLLAGDSTGALYRTVNGGASWTAASGVATGSWIGAASSASGSSMMAGRNNGYIYTVAGALTGTTTPGPTGYLQGPQASAIEVQYIGNSEWLPLSYAGTMTAH